MEAVQSIGEFLKPWGWLLSLLFTGLALMAAAAMHGRYVTRQDMAERDEKLAKAADKHADEHKEADRERAALAKIVEQHGQHLKQLPTQEEVHDLEIQITELKGTIGALTERIAGLGNIVERAERVVSRQEAYLLRQGGN